MREWIESLLSSTPPLQNQLTTACKQGDLKTVQATIAQGAKLDIHGEKQLHAAIWGMNPAVVAYLLAIMKKNGIFCLSWETYAKQIQVEYGEIFIFDKFQPNTYPELYSLLQKMDYSPFIQTYCFEGGLKPLDGGMITFENLETFKNHVSLKVKEYRWLLIRWEERERVQNISGNIAYKLTRLREQIQQNIEAALITDSPQVKKERTATITDFFNLLRKSSMPKEVIDSISDYEFKI